MESYVSSPGIRGLLVKSCFASARRMISPDLSSVTAVMPILEKAAPLTFSVFTRLEKLISFWLFSTAPFSMAIFPAPNTMPLRVLILPFISIPFLSASPSANSRPVALNSPSSFPSCSSLSYRVPNFAKSFLTASATFWSWLPAALFVKLVLHKLSK